MNVMSFSKARLAAILMLILACVSLAIAANAPNKALLLNIDGAIGPATSDYLQRGIAQAVEKKASLVIIRLDTPGGLDKSMRGIIKAMLASPVPVVTYVSPSGARAASAGTFMLYASHVAAMAPGTNLGAATPVSIGGGGGLPTPEKPDKPDKPGKPDKKAKKDTEKTPKPKASDAMTKKVTNDAIAYIRSLAELRGRNVEWAEKAVREAASISAQKAVQLKVVDLMVDNVDDLLKKIDGRKVKVRGAIQVLKTANLTIETIHPDWRTKFLGVITDPSIAYILMLIAMYGLFFEFANPGFIVPGVVGAIALILALYAFQLLPISYAGLGLVLLGIIFMIAEAFMPSFGALGIGGVIAFVAGSILLFDADVPGYQIAWPIIAAMALVNAGFFFVVVGMAIRARRRKIVSGSETLIGKAGTVLNDCQGRGQARINGEIWQISCPVGLKRGTVVKVLAVNGLILDVEKEE